MTGTRWTRCTPPSNFSSAYGASPGLRRATSLDRDGDRLVATEVRRGVVQDLGAPAALLGVPRVHAQQVRREKRRLLAALAGLDLEDRVLAVGRVARDQQLTQPLLRRLVTERLSCVELVGERSVLGGQLTGSAEVVLELLPLPVGAHDSTELGVTLVQPAQRAGIGVDGGI